MSIVEKINDMVYNFQRTNRYYPGYLYIGKDVFENLVREVEDQIKLSSNGSVESFMGMRLRMHDNPDVCYVQ
jgi:hypothetical protein